MFLLHNCLFICMYLHTITFYFLEVSIFSIHIISLLRDIFFLSACIICVVFLHFDDSSVFLCLCEFSCYCCVFSRLPPATCPFRIGSLPFKSFSSVIITLSSVFIIIAELFNARLLPKLRPCFR